jgi:hypothetical protein
MLGWWVLAPFSQEIIGKFGQHFKCSPQPFTGFPQHDLIASPENLNYLALDGEFFWQPDGLAIT